LLLVYSIVNVWSTAKNITEKTQPPAA